MSTSIETNLPQSTENIAIPADLPQPSDYQVQAFNDVRCLLANLYHFTIAQRKHLKTKRGYIEATQQSYDPEELNKLQFYFTALMLKFKEKQWKDISLINTPKLPDIYLLKLTEHQLFEGKPVEEFMSPTKFSEELTDLDDDTKKLYRKVQRIGTKETRVLKELAIRLS